MSGRIEVYLNGQWGTICDDVWGTSVMLANAKVACRQLGLPWSGALAAHYGPNDALPILTDNVACVGSETTLSTCPRRTEGSSNCGHTGDIGE